MHASMIKITASWVGAVGNTDVEGLSSEGCPSNVSAQMMMAASGMQPAMMPGAMPSMAGSAAPAHELMQQMHMQRVCLHSKMELMSDLPSGLFPSRALSV